MTPPTLTHVTTIKAYVNKPIELGQIATGMRRVIPITGGVANGPLIKGKIGGGFNDYQLVRSDNVAEIQARYVIETDDRAMIYVENNGIRHASPENVAKLIRGEAVDPALVYFRAIPTLSCSDPRYEWVNRHLFLCTASRFPDSLELVFWRID
jgi:hypothetical protein